MQSSDRRPTVRLSGQDVGGCENEFVARLKKQATPHYDSEPQTKLHYHHHAYHQKIKAAPLHH
jgi:hypothetical protein